MKEQQVIINGKKGTLIGTTELLLVAHNESRGEFQSYTYDHDLIFGDIESIESIETLEEEEEKPAKTNTDFVIELMNDNDRMMQVFVIEAIQDYASKIVANKESFINSFKTVLINPHHWVSLAEKALQSRDDFYKDEDTTQKRITVFKGQHWSIDTLNVNEVDAEIVTNIKDTIMLYQHLTLSVAVLETLIKELVPTGYIIGRGSAHVWIHKIDNNDFGIWVTNF